MRWHLLVTPPWSGAANMAVDAALLDRAAGSGDAFVRAYAWGSPTVSFGAHERAAGAYDAARLASDGYDVVRRPTGGRAILHARELTYAIARPVAPGEGLRESAAALTALVADALARLGVEARPAATARVAAPTEAPCFAAPAPGELVVEGAKLVGSAQVRRDGALLQHGSILVDDEQGRLRHYRRLTAPPTVPAATLRQALGRAPELREFAAALADAVAARTGILPSPFDAGALDAGSVRRHVAYFRDPAWTWRR